MPGKYIVQVDPTWDPSADYHRDFKKITVDIYCPENLNIETVSRTEGVAILTQTLKDVAQNIVPKDKRSYHLASNKDYGRDAYRVTDLNESKCWYGFIYTKNDSGYELKEDIKPTLKGLEVFGRSSTIIQVPSGGDDIIILRRNDGSCSFSLSYNTIPRELSEAELIQKAKMTPEKKISGDITYHMVSEIAGVCIYVKNVSERTAFKVKFTFGLTNLAIKGVPPGQNEITLEMNSNGGNAVCFLKPVKLGEGTNFKMSISASQFAGRSNDEADPQIQNWVNMIWSNYDTDGNGILDMMEAWKFVKENMANQVS